MYKTKTPNDIQHHVSEHVLSQSDRKYFMARYREHYTGEDKIKKLNHSEVGSRWKTFLYRTFRKTNWDPDKRGSLCLGTKGSPSGGDWAGGTLCGSI